MKEDKIYIQDKEISVTCLNPSHRSRIIDFISNNPHTNTLSYNSSILDTYLNPNSSFPVLFGAFQKQTLLCISGLWRWETLPYATITYLITRFGNNFFNSSTNGHSHCFDEMIKYGHKHNIAAYYFFRKKRRDDFCMWKDNKTVSQQANKYFSYTEAVIPKNTRPKEIIYWELMDKEIKPFTGVIRRIMLKPEFLNSLLWM